MGPAQVTAPGIARCHSPRYPSPGIAGRAADPSMIAGPLNSGRGPLYCVQGEGAVGSLPNLVPIRGGGVVENTLIRLKRREEDAMRLSRQDSAEATAFRRQLGVALWLAVKHRPQGKKSTLLTDHPGACRVTGFLPTVAKPVRIRPAAPAEVLTYTDQHERGTEVHRRPRKQQCQIRVRGYGRRESPAGVRCPRISSEGYVRRSRIYMMGIPASYRSALSF